MLHNGDTRQVRQRYDLEHAISAARNEGQLAHVKGCVRTQPGRQRRNLLADFGYALPQAAIRSFEAAA